MFKIDQKARFSPLIGIIDQNAALAKQRLEPFNNNIGGRIKKWMTRCEQFRLGLPIDLRFFEGDTRIAIKDWIAAADQAIILCASSHIIRSQSGAAASLAFSSSDREAISSRIISRLRSMNGFPEIDASI